MTWLRRGYRSFRAFLMRAAAPQGVRRRWVLLVGIFAIVLWQMGFASDRAKVDDTFHNTSSSGMHNERHFVYFFWYLDQFPVTSTLSYYPCSYKCADRTDTTAPLGGGFSHAEAEAFVAAHGNTLVQDSSWTWMAGDRGKIFLYFLDTWLKGVPYHPSVIPMHRLVFITALCALFASFWYRRRVTLGAASVVLLGSNPFQLYEVNRHENVFSWAISTAILLLAIHLPLVTGKRWRARHLIALSIFVGFLMATIRTVRSEPFPLVAACVLVYLQAKVWPEDKSATDPRKVRRRTWIVRGLMIASFLVTLDAAGVMYRAYFVHKHVKAREFVAKLGGHPYPGSVRMYHHIWHSIWCGLGDFDTKYGYKWEDGKALAYARPILEEKYKLYVPHPDFNDRRPGECWDADCYYHKFAENLPEYETVMRDKVLSDVKKDPKWVLDIVWKRIKRVVTETTPVRISTAERFKDLPWAMSWGKAFIAFLALCLLARERLFVNLLLFSLPTCATAILVFSGGGVQLYGIFHIFAAIVAIGLFVQLARVAAAKLVAVARARVQPPVKGRAREGGPLSTKESA